MKEKKERYGFMAEEFTTRDGKTIELDIMDGFKISKWYEAALTAEFIMNNPDDYGIVDENKAWHIACLAREIMARAYDGDEEENAIYEAIKQYKEEK